MEQFKEGWYQFFFKGLIEFSRESIRSCKVLNSTPSTAKKEKKTLYQPYFA
jgi:hypothetical protein